MWYYFGTFGFILHDIYNQRLFSYWLTGCQRRDNNVEFTARIRFTKVYMRRYHTEGMRSKVSDNYDRSLVIMTGSCEYFYPDILSMSTETLQVGWQNGDYKMASVANVRPLVGRV